MREESKKFCTEFSETASTRNIEQNWNAFEAHMKQLVKEHVPKKNVGGRYHLPWMTSTMRRMYRKKGRLYSKAKKKGARWKEFIEFQESPQQALKKAHWQYVNRMLSQGLKEGAQKPFWHYVRSQRQDSQGISSLLKGNKLRSDPATTAGNLNEQFCLVFTVDEPETANISLEGPSYPPQDPLYVTEAGVHKLLKNLNPGKASGPDDTNSPTQTWLMISPPLLRASSVRRWTKDAHRTCGGMPGWSLCSRRAAEMIQRIIVPCH